MHDIKKWLWLGLLAAAIFALAFLLSSGAMSSLEDRASSFIKVKLNTIETDIRETLVKHINVFAIYLYEPKYHLIFPPGTYAKSYLRKGLPREALFPILANAFFNSLFQPLFLCVFTPQVMLVCALFPFFLYGCIKYFKKVPIMIIFFIWYSTYLGLRQPVAEALIRHRLSCELFYISISLAGFFYLIKRRSL